MLEVASKAQKELESRLHCFHVVQTGKHLLQTQNVSEQNQKHFLCQLQYVHNNVSPLARALRYNALYSDTEINYNVPVSLPENEVPQQLLSIKTEKKVIDDTINALQIVALLMKKKTFIM